MFHLSKLSVKNTLSFLTKNIIVPDRLFAMDNSYNGNADNIKEQI